MLKAYNRRLEKKKVIELSPNLKVGQKLNVRIAANSKIQIPTTK